MGGTTHLYVNNNRNDHLTLYSKRWYDYDDMIYILLLTPGGGSSWEFLVGAAWFSKSWPYFRPKNVIFHTRFQTRSVKSTPTFRPGLLGSSRLSDSEGKLPVSQFSGRPNYLGAWNRQTKNSSNAFRIRIYLFRSYFFKFKRQIRSYVHMCTPVVPSDPNQNERSVFKPKRPKHHTL